MGNIVNKRSKRPRPIPFPKISITPESEIINIRLGIDQLRVKYMCITRELSEAKRSQMISDCQMLIKRLERELDDIKNIQEKTQLVNDLNVMKKLVDNIKV